MSVEMQEMEMQEEVVTAQEVPQSRSFRLSPQQRQLWARIQEGDVFRVQCALALAGPVDREALRTALQAVVDRHEILRTTFPRRPGIRFPLQQIAERGRFEWSEADAGPALDERLRQERERPFDLESGAPLRAALAVAEDGNPALILTLPALCADAKTLAILAGEIGSAYAAASGGVGEEEAVQHCAFSEWQHELLESEEEAAAGFAYWRAQRTGVSPAFPGEPVRPAVPGTWDGRVEIAVGTREAEALEGIARSRGATMETLLLAAWQALFGRLGHAGDLPVGFAADGRSHEDLAGTCGPLTRYIPVAGTPSDDWRLASWFKRVEQAVDEARGWQEYWTEEVAPSLGFDYQEWPAAEATGNLSWTVVRQRVDLDRFLLRLSVWRPAGGSLHLGVHYDPSRISAQAAEILARRFELLLAGIAADPNQPLDRIGLSDQDELRRLLIDFNSATAPWPQEATAHKLFEEQAARTPGRVAVRAGGEELTYAELEGRANRLAVRLRSVGVGPEALVALYCCRSADMVVGILGILKAGGAFLPLDAGHPKERLGLILEDARPQVLLTEERLLSTVPEPAPRHVLSIESPESAGSFDEANFDRQATAENLAYVIHTSGSTGRPKGVLVPHRGLVHYLAWCAKAYGATEGQVTPVHSPIGFDLTFTSLFVPLVTGGTALLLPEAPGVEALAAALGGDLGLVKLTPSHLDLLARSESVGAGTQVNAFVIGGEALRSETLADWRKLRPGARLINEYGPTETVVGCAVFEAAAEGEASGPVPIGRPIANLRIYVLDRHGVPAPAGVAGEMYVGGPGVARGYLHRPDATAERFVPDPFGGERGDRLYRTGDLARHLPNGNLEFLGRYDHQVKIKGHRIELGEIEAALLGFPGVREAAVAVRRDAAGDSRLVAYVAYVASAAGVRPKSGDLRGLLADRLPEAMIPSQFVVLDALPLSPNGKVDRAALPDPGAAERDLEGEYVAPQTDLERQLAEIWAETLGVERVGIADGFFALGGDSIRSVRAVALAKKQNLIFTVQNLFQYPTVAQLAEFLESAGENVGVAEETDEDLARLLDELESLSEEEAGALARDRSGEGAI